MLTELASECLFYYSLYSSIAHGLIMGSNFDDYYCHFSSSLTSKLHYLYFTYSFLLLCETDQTTPTFLKCRFQVNFGSFEHQGYFSSLSNLSFPLIGLDDFVNTHYLFFKMNLNYFPYVF